MNHLRLLFLAIFSTLSATAELPRVAVVTDSPDPLLSIFADFLTVSLDLASEKYALVDREEITKLGAESEIQKLAADQRPIALSRLAEADGIIIVGSQNSDPDNPKITVRLSSTNNGLVLSSLVLGGKEAELKEAAELASGVLRFPSERLESGDENKPTIVSLLGIRPAFENDRSLEITLNLAVAQHLSAQTGIAVSERWRMNDLVFERSLGGVESEDLSTGTILVDGSYSRSGDQLEVSLRLREAESVTGNTFVLKGDATKPVDLVRKIAELVATESGRGGRAVAWSASEEARSYADLGRWLYVRNLFKEAAAAIESAIALGNSDGDVLYHRISAYYRAVDFGMGFSPESTQAGNWHRLPKSVIKDKIMVSVRCTQYCNDILDLDFGNLTQKQSPRTDRISLLRAIFTQNMKLLQAVCLRGEKVELATEARALRTQSRAMVSKGKNVFENNFVGEIVDRFYMHETPEQAAEDLRSLLDSENLSDVHWSEGQSLRNRFWNTSRHLVLPRFVDWNSPDDKHGQAVWKALLRELISSKQLLLKVDGLALSFQSSDSNEERERILKSYVNLLNSRFVDLIEPSGQMSFYSFQGYFITEHEEGQNPEVHSGLADILTRIFESKSWIQPATINMTHWAVFDWAPNLEKGTKSITDSEASELLNAIENYIRWARDDPRWKSQYQNKNFGSTEEWLLKVPGKIIHSFPSIKDRRISAGSEVEGAVSIHGWKPDLPLVKDKNVHLNANHMVARGKSLLVPSSEYGVIELDTAKLSISRIIGLPSLDRNFINGLAASNDSLMMLMDNQLFVTSLDKDETSWGEIKIPDLIDKNDLSWRIDGLENSFFIGSRMPSDTSGDQRTLAGKVVDGKVTWLVSSNRRPAVNPLDKIDPGNARFAYRNAKGKTIALLDHRFNGAPLVELESGRRFRA